MLLAGPIPHNSIHLLAVFCDLFPSFCFLTIFLFSFCSHPTDKLSLFLANNFVSSIEHTTESCISFLGISNDFNVSACSRKTLLLVRGLILAEKFGTHLE